MKNKNANMPDKQIEYWAHMLDESALVEDDANVFTVYKLLEFIKQNVEEDASNKRFMDSNMHYGPNGYHVGDIEEVKREGNKVVFIIKRAKQNTKRRGPVDGCMSVEEVVDALRDLISADEMVNYFEIWCTIPVDELAKRLGKKPESYKLANCEVAKIDGIWLRPEDKPL